MKTSPHSYSIGDFYILKYEITKFYKLGVNIENNDK